MYSDNRRVLQYTARKHCRNAICRHTFAVGAYINDMESNDLSFCELRRLEVINGSDGKRLGHITDIVFSCDSGKVKGIIIPYGKRGIFSKNQDLFVPWKRKKKIGEDVIIIEINECPSAPPKPERECAPNRPCPPRPPAPPRSDRDCDGKCEKCMLFDCAHRWQSA